MSADEILQMIWELCDTNTKPTIETMNELIVQITDDPKKLAYDLSTRLDEWSLERQSCPLCGGEIIQLEKENEPSEYLGQPVNEIINRYGCEECSYIVD